MYRGAHDGGNGPWQWALRRPQWALVPVIAALLVAGTVAAVLHGDRSGNGPAVAVAAAVGATASPPPTGPPPTSPALAAAPSTVAPPPPTTAAPPPTAPPTPEARLDQRLRAAMAGAQGCVLAQQGDTTVFAASADMPLAPASTLKLLTAAAALTRLGPDFRFQTTVVSAAPPQDGAVEDLWLVGSGDPVLWTPEYSAFSSRQPEMAGFLSTPLAGLADGVAAAGVRSVARGVHGDDSHLDRTRYVPSWPAKYRSDVDVGPLGALSVDGGLQAWEPKAVAADDPASLASGALARLLSARGVTAGGAGDEPAPAHPVVLARVQSPSLSELVTGMLRVSDNYTAELLVREMDRHAGGPGTTAGGVAEVARALADLGLPTSGMHLVDGSGLDPANRSTCRLELAAMDLGRRPGLGAIEAGLARAAASGTLIHRFQGTPEAGRLEAKTGWIGGAVAIVGHMEVKAPLRFAFIANGSFGWAVARPLEDRVVQALATWPETS